MHEANINEDPTKSVRSTEIHKFLSKEKMVRNIRTRI